MPTIDSVDSWALDAAPPVQEYAPEFVRVQDLASTQASLIFADHAYFGVFVLFILSFVAFNYTLKIQRFISRKLAKRNNEKLKMAPYECGPVPIKQPAKISHHFFIIALLFVLFDIEVVFMIPWAVVYKSFVASNMGLFVLIEMVSFVLLLVVGLIYAWKKGALRWQNME
ncbi:NAD(P)H-quinone oxidoreductase subunit 3 [Helicobacter canis]|uniref:NADH-quinone oxidoreductase subunit n=1 Tax=Helicobacter canis TaxID=29419 RepID=A0A5M9QJ08_9HELI|nr:NAD(P)H-quinone oxidoreductase subunit 3 [Helicobacter canis]